MTNRENVIDLSPLCPNPSAPDPATEAEFLELLQRVYRMGAINRQNLCKAIKMIDEGRPVILGKKGDRMSLRYFTLRRGQWPTREWQDSCIRNTNGREAVVYKAIPEGGPAVCMDYLDLVCRREDRKDI